MNIFNRVFRIKKVTFLIWYTCFTSMSCMNKSCSVILHFLCVIASFYVEIRNIIFDWMEHYRSAIGISRPSKLSLLMKKRKQMNSANSLPGSMPSFPRRSTSPLPRAPSAPPVPKLSPNRISFNAKEVSVKR